MWNAEALPAVASLWRRHGQVYARQWHHSLLTTLAEPFIYLLSFGLGMSTVVDHVSIDGQTLSYRAFVFAGIVAQSVLYQGFFAAAHGAFSRFHYQKLYLAMLTAPVTFSEVLWAELLWNASRASLSSAAILMAGCLIGDFPFWNALAALPLCFMGALLFTALGIGVAALARTFSDLSNAQFCIVTPMVLLCGIFFPIEGLSEWMQLSAWLFPLTPVLSLLRSLLLGLEVQLQALPLMAAWLAACVVLAHGAMKRRLVK